MKKIWLFLLLMTAFTGSTFASASLNSNPSTASNASYFNFNTEQISAQTAELSDLETYVQHHDGVTYDQLVAEGNTLVANADAVNGLGIDHALTHGGGMPTWAIVLIVVGGLLLIGLAFCCLLSAASTPQ